MEWANKSFVSKKKNIFNAKTANGLSSEQTLFVEKKKLQKLPRTQRKWFSIFLRTFSAAQPINQVK